jgi:proteasome alpha subunit
MSTPFYVSPEQLMKDKSDYARKGIARGRSVLTLAYADGILFVGENPSNALHKISEIYDRIAFAAVGKYNEFENLRLAGVRYADLRGYQYDRRDVTSRGLANAYAQTLGTIFTESGKPYEVEIVVAEVGERPGDDQLYRLTYDGSVAEEHGHVVMGGNSEPLAAYVRERHDPGASLDAVLRLGVEALSQTGPDGAPRTIAAGDLEAAVLDRTRPRRAFSRLVGPRLERLLGQETSPA